METQSQSGDMYVSQNRRMPKVFLCFPLGRSLEYLQSHSRDRLWWKEVGSNKAGECFLGLSRHILLLIKKGTELHKSKASRNFPSLWEGKTNTNAKISETRNLISLPRFREKCWGVIVWENGSSLN